MAWLKIDDRVRTHPKIADAGPAAAWLWFCGICYCREHLTDGVIRRSAVGTLAMNLPSPLKHAQKLVAVGLWEPHADGFLVHDFLDWNPSRAEVMSLRDKERDKKRTQRGTDAGLTGERAPARDHAGDAGLGSLSGSRVLGSAAEENPDPDSAAFDRFWQAYPNRKAKAAALKAWQKLAPDAVLEAEIVAALAWQTRQPSWLKDGGAFVPHAATWLNQRRWEDEPSAASAPAGAVHDMAWVEECATLHGGACESRYQHGLRTAP